MDKTDTHNMQTISVTKSSKDFSLLDSGEGEKLERWGNVTLVRPDPQALWSRRLPDDEWKKADARFIREGRDGAWRWRDDNNKKSNWTIAFGGMTFEIKPTAFKHTGLFPEQLPNWEWLGNKVAQALKAGVKDIEILNLFGYTGGATLAVAKAGAKVVHVDGSKAAITWARQNAELSGLGDKPVRWILEDVRTFVKREIKRGRKYQGIVMDPPAFGHGAEKEVWNIEDDFLPLIADCVSLLADDAQFFLINGYSSGYSPIAYTNNLLTLTKEKGGVIESGELTIEEATGGRLLPAGIFSRWSK